MIFCENYAEFKNEKSAEWHENCNYPKEKVLYNNSLLRHHRCKEKNLIHH